MLLTASQTQPTAASRALASGHRHVAFLSELRLDLLHTFVVLAEELSFSRAASRLHLSQPGLSRRIRVLEQTTGQALVQRTPRPVQLTAAGLALLPHAEAILAAACSAVDSLVDSEARAKALDGLELIPAQEGRQVSR